MISKYKALGVAGTLSLVSGSAFAALPLAATTALTDLSTAVTDAVDGAWPIIAAAMVAFGIIKFVKRAVNKA